MAEEDDDDNARRDPVAGPDPARHADRDDPDPNGAGAGGGTGGSALPAPRPSGSNPKPYRPRHDGWTAERQRLFIEALTRTGCVRDACRAARISSTSAYRTRRRIPEFSASWDLALRRARTPLEEVAWKRAVDGRETVIIRGGKEVERRIMPSDSILSLLIRRSDLGGKIGARTADKVLTWEEWQAGLRFDDQGQKVDESVEAEAVWQSLDRKLADMRVKLLARRAREEEEERQRAAAGRTDEPGAGDHAG